MKFMYNSVRTIKANHPYLYLQLEDGARPTAVNNSVAPVFPLAVISESRAAMGKVTLAVVPHLTIMYDSTTGILYADWTGNQTKESVVDGCERILYYLKKYNSTKVLNDNTHVTSIWLEAAWWVAVDWFPRMYEANCQLFAWVESPDPLGKLSIEETLKFEVTGVNALTFSNKKLAEEWLKEYDTH